MQSHTRLSLQGVEQLVSSMWPVSRDVQLLVWVHSEQRLSLRLSKICLCTSSVLLTTVLALLTLRGIEVFVVVSPCVPQPCVYQPLLAYCSRAENPMQLCNLIHELIKQLTSTSPPELTWMCISINTATAAIRHANRWLADWLHSALTLHSQ